LTPEAKPTWILPSVTGTLEDRLDDACREHGFEWVVLPFEESPESWRSGPYWGAFMKAEDPPQEGRRRFYRYNGFIKGRENLPDPDVVFHDARTDERKGRQTAVARRTDLTTGAWTLSWASDASMFVKSPVVLPVRVAGTDFGRGSA